MDLTSLPITHRATIPDSYLDVMGHMNVMWYTHLFSLGAWGLFQKSVWTSDYFETNRAGSFALEQHFRYLKEVRVGQQITDSQPRSRSYGQAVAPDPLHDSRRNRRPGRDVGVRAHARGPPDPPVVADAALDLRGNRSFARGTSATVVGARRVCGALSP